MGQICKDLKRQTSILGDNELINIDLFSSAVLSNERISFDALVKLFDKDKKMSKVERFFTLRELYQCLQDAKEASLQAQREKEKAAKAGEELVGEADKDQQAEIIHIDLEKEVEPRPPPR